ncbi:hypothetical protein NBEOAGPD_0129 [Methylobacterium gregans]|uniref:Uncharacterized protein n=2 Tax=Methylobacterium gregans TaxID=374424 RepID=A0AA37HJW3_9HYPH|nr:hypothetical protein NBEOAGPD_0129 [Methylobacterium gregans]
MRAAIRAAMRTSPAPVPCRRAIRRRLAHLCRLVAAGLFLATCGVASYTAGARHRAEPGPERAANPICPG